MEIYICTLCRREFESKPTTQCPECGSPVFLHIKKFPVRVKLVNQNFKDVPTLLFYGKSKPFGKRLARLFGEDFYRNLGEEEFSIVLDKKNGKVYIEPGSNSLVQTSINGQPLKSKTELKEGDEISVGSLLFKVVIEWREEEVEEITIGRKKK